MYIWILVIIILIIQIKFLKYEMFTQNQDKYKYQKVDNLKSDLYMNFLGDLKISLKKNMTNKKQKMLCNDKVRIKVQTNALNEAFKKIPLNTFKSPVFDKTLNKLNFIDNSINDCVYKANHISEFTNPMFYLSDTITFPPRWLIKTYDNIPLPKHTNLKQWSNMYNCCKIK